MNRYILSTALVLSLAATFGVAFGQQQAAEEKPATPCCCAPIACDLFVGLRNLLSCAACAPVCAEPQKCEPVVCPAPEPSCCPPLFPCARAGVVAVGQQLRQAVCCPPACVAPPCPVEKVEKPVTCPAPCRPSLVETLRARLACPPAPCCRCGGLLGAVLQLIGCGPAPCCCQVEAAEPTPAASPTEAPGEAIKPLPEAPKAPKPDASA
ncbi:MAG: hypothetical protein NZ899_06610 [Thermoguttaceae bacterium]|nr:hypothetical protein [Thermoguttaceae bacterium]MDW8078560.1 hypothetical protein [Thermoguttaceae bacterium]